MCAALPSWSAFRRAVAMLCALAFLAVGFAHIAQHLDAGSHSAVSQVGGGADDDAKPAKDANAIEHCHACTMVAVFVDFQSMPRIPSIADRQVLTTDTIRPHVPLAETPPPIAAI